MTKPKKTVSTGWKADADKNGFKKSLLNNVTLAAWEGVAAFLQHNPFSLAEIKGREPAILKQVTEALSSVTYSLLFGILLREGGFRIPKVRSKSGGRRRGKVPKNLPELEIGKIHERFGLVPPHAEGQEFAEMRKRSGLPPVPKAAFRTMQRKLLESKIHSELSSEEQRLFYWKFAEDRVIESITVNEEWMKHVGSIMQRAAMGDGQFFVRLGVALYNDRESASFSQDEAFLIWNWDDLQEDPRFPKKILGLKYWRDEAVRSLLVALFHSTKGDDLELSAYRSMKDRIGLRPEKKKIVRSCVWLSQKKRFSVHSENSAKQLSECGRSQ